MSDESRCRLAAPRLGRLELCGEWLGEQPRAGIGKTRTLLREGGCYDGYTNSTDSLPSPWVPGQTSGDLPALELLIIDATGSLLPDERAAAILPQPIGDHCARKRHPDFEQEAPDRGMVFSDWIVAPAVLERAFPRVTGVNIRGPYHRLRERGQARLLAHFGQKHGQNWIPRLAAEGPSSLSGRKASLLAGSQHGLTCHSARAKATRRGGTLGRPVARLRNVDPPIPRWVTIPQGRNTIG